MLIGNGVLAEMENLKFAAPQTTGRSWREEIWRGLSNPIQRDVAGPVFGKPIA